MKRRSKAILVVVGLGVALAAGSSFFPRRLYGERVAGQVVDADSGNPIAGAHVALFWESPIEPRGFTAHNSRDICFHAAATISDSQGRFSIPRWHEWSRYSVESHDPIAIVYARGYTPRQIVMYEGEFRPPVERPNERFALQRFAGSADERLNVMWTGIANHGCSYGGESQKSLYPMLKAMYEEARDIAVSGHINDVRAFSVMAARAALAPDPDGPANGVAIENFVREHLQ